MRRVHAAMRQLLMLLGAFSMALAPACVSSKEPAPAGGELKNPAEITVRGFRLTLEGNQLRFAGNGSRGVLALEPWDAWGFSRDKAGSIRVVRTGGSETLLVETSRHVGPLPSDCLTHLRGVVVTDKEVRISSKTQRVAQCLPAVWDEKMFHVFAQKTEPITAER